MKIMVINPTISEGLAESTLATYRGYASPSTEISQVFLRHGPESIESDFDIALAVPDILGHVLRAEQEGMDAVVIDCMSDPGLFAARELVEIPVIGPAQTSMSLAATLADRFTIIGVLERDRPIFHNLWRLYDLEGRGASVRVVDIPVLSLHEDEEELIQAMIAQAALAIAEDHAHAIVFGCTGMGGLADPIRQGLEESGFAGIPVIDPTGVALKVAESLVDLHLSHSKQTFPQPAAKQVVGYEHLQLS
ncbi:MAG: aspartate/glutamate racemase family protein [Chloroflexi bacterium]|nr:aspartate/glutamate racemase family protein [Chloroflexota bacterium]